MNITNDQVEKDVRLARHIVEGINFRGGGYGPGEVKANAVQAVLHGIRAGRAQGIEMAEQALKKAFVQVRRAAE